MDKSCIDLTEETTCDDDSVKSQETGCKRPCVNATIVISDSEPDSSDLPDHVCIDFDSQNDDCLSPNMKKCRLSTSSSSANKTGSSANISYEHANSFHSPLPDDGIKRGPLTITPDSSPEPMLREPDFPIFSQLLDDAPIEPAPVNLANGPKEFSKRSKTKQPKPPPKPRSTKQICQAEVPEDFAQYLVKTNKEDAINLLNVHLDEAQVNHTLVTNPKYKDCITWTYEKKDVVDNELVTVKDSAPRIILLIDGQEYLNKLLAFKQDKVSDNSLFMHLKRFKEKVESRHLTLLVNNFSQCLKLKRAQEVKEYRQAFKEKYEGIGKTSASAKETASDAFAPMNDTDLYELRLSLQLELDFEFRDWVVHINFVESKEALVACIEKHSKAVAKIPAKQTSNFEWAINMDKARAYDPTKSREDHTKLWLAQLQQFPLVTMPMAKAIVKEYPFPYALIDQYRELNEDEGEILLAELYKQKTMNRQIGTNISKRIYCFATCKDPNTHIGLC